jgi:hypothetical protein
VPREGVVQGLARPALAPSGALPYAAKRVLQVSCFSAAGGYLHGGLLLLFPFIAFRSCCWSFFSACHFGYLGSC